MGNRVGDAGGAIGNRVPHARAGAGDRIHAGHHTVIDHVLVERDVAIERHAADAGRNRNVDAEVVLAVLLADQRGETDTGRAGRYHRARSEEHTSELQSH